MHVQYKNVGSQDNEQLPQAAQFETHNLNSKVPVYIILLMACVLYLIAMLGMALPSHKSAPSQSHSTSELKHPLSNLNSQKSSQVESSLNHQSADNSSKQEVVKDIEAGPEKTVSQKVYTWQARVDELTLSRPVSEVVKIHNTFNYTDPLPTSFVLQELPFCLVTFNVSQDMLIAIQQSVKKCDYSNFKHAWEQKQEPAKRTKTLYQLIRSNCPKEFVVVLVSAPLKFSALQRLNKAYQQSFTWLTYHKRDEQLLNGVSSFFNHLLELLSETYLEQNAKGDAKMEIRLIAKSLMKIGKYRGTSLQYNELFYQKPEREGVEYFIGKIDPHLQAEPASPAISLWPYPWYSHYTAFNYDRFVLSQLKEPAFPIDEAHHPKNNLHLNNLLRAIEYLQLKNLPKQHSLAIRECAYYENKYKLQKSEEQLPLCVVVPSNDNTQGDRYKKSLKSIAQQEYSNFYLVFIDDASTDGTFELAQQYLFEELGFPTTKAKFIKNEVRMFATYNIRQAVREHCRNLDREVVVLVDGDDELVGKQVFSLVNAGYHRKLGESPDASGENWILYFSLMTSDFGFGVSKDPSYALLEGPRQKYHVFGALRTFYSSLFLKVKEEDHRGSSGQFLQTLYDDALQYPMFEMAGPQHIEYVPQIVYFYNRFYGGNDDHRLLGRQERAREQEALLRRQRYERVDRLFE